MASGMAGYKSILKYNYDVAKAKQLLDDAGWKVNASTNIREKDGVPLKANFYTAEGEYPKDLQVAEAVQAYLKAVGADIQIVKVEAAAIRTFRKVPAAESKYDIMMFGFNASNGDPSYHLQSNWLSNADETVAPAVWNMMWYKNPDVDKAIQDSLVIVDPAKRQEALTKAQTLIMQDAPNLFLYTPQIVNATRFPGVKLVVITPDAHFGYGVPVLTNPFGAPIEAGALSGPLTVLWVLVVINAINLIDGLDGLASGAVLIASVALWWVARTHADFYVMFVASVLIGATAGFLRYNFPPARIFMGDTLLITVTGRKTGKKYSTPVGFYRDGDFLWVLTSRDRTWWRNVRPGAEVSVLLNGKTLHAFAEAELDETAVASHLLDYI